LKDERLKQIMLNIGISPDRVEKSKYLPQILEVILPEDEDKDFMMKFGKGGTVKQLLENKQLNLEKKELMKKINKYLSIGIIAPVIDKKTLGIDYKPTPTVGLQDAIMLDPRYKYLGPKWYDLWQGFFEEDMIPEMHKMEKLEEHVFRVIPINEMIDAPENQILSIETVEGIIKKSRKIATWPCVCRTRSRKCDYPVDVCMGFGFAAEFVIRKGFGRRVTKEEALAIKRRATDAGLVHICDNASKGIMFICSCCPCCCIALNSIIEHGYYKWAAKSRYIAELNEENCTGCGTCEEKCHFGAIKLEENKEIAVIDSEKCFGCGQCVYFCPSDALKLKLNKEKSHIPQKDSAQKFLEDGFALGNM